MGHKTKHVLICHLCGGNGLPYNMIQSVGNTKLFGLQNRKDIRKWEK